MSSKRDPYVADYLSSNEELVLAPSSVKTYSSHLSQYLTFLESKEIDLIDAEEGDVVEFVEDCVRSGNRASTIQGKLVTVIQLYRHIHLQMGMGDRLSLDPLKLETIDLGKYKTPHELKRVALSREEVRKLFDAITSFRNLLLVVTGVETGLRNSDLRNLQLDDVDHEDLIITVRNPKGGSPYDVPISDDLSFELEYWIQEYRPGYGGEMESEYLFPAQTMPRLTTNGSLNGIVTRAATRAGIQDTIGTSILAPGQKRALNTEKDTRDWMRVTMHTLRHTYITLLQEAEVPLSYRQLVANHRNPETTRGYSHHVKSGFEKIRDQFEPPR